MFLTRSFLPPPPFALPIGGHANSFRPVFFSSASASVDLKGRLEIIKLAAFNVCCHQQEQRFGFKDGWRRGGKHQRAKMWVSVKVFYNELQRGHTGSDTDRHARNKHRREAFKDAVKQTRLLSPQRVARSHPLLAEQEITPWGHSRLEAPMGQKTGKVRRGDNYHWWNRKSLEPWDVQRNHFSVWQKYVFPLVIGRSSQLLLDLMDSGIVALRALRADLLSGIILISLTLLSFYSFFIYWWI